MTDQAVRDGQAGLTLVEVLVSLALFSLIGLSGFAMLDTILRVRSGTEGRLERQAQIDRALVLFTRDLQEADTASIRQDSGMLTVVRSGTGPISYESQTGALLRLLPRSDFEQQLIDNVLAMRLRSFDSTGAWHQEWPQEQTQTLGFPPRLKAIELELDLPEGTVSRLVDLPAGLEE